MPFQKGTSGNPKGRSRSSVTPETRLRQHQIERVFDFLLQASMLDILRQPHLRFEYLRILLPYVTKRKVAALLPREEALTKEQLEAEFSEPAHDSDGMVNSNEDVHN